MIKTFSFSFESLQITASDLEKHIGYKQQSSIHSFGVFYDEVLQKVADLCNIRGGYRIYEDVYLPSISQSVLINGKVLSPGNIIFNQLKGISGAAVFLCTAGPELSIMAKKLSSGEDILAGYLYDVAGTICVEKAMDMMELYFENEMHARGHNITSLQSPGHCGWDVSAQQTLFSLLPEGFCGVHLSSSSLMYPAKSVSGIIGFGEKVRKKARPCGECHLRPQCLYFNKRNAIAP